LNERGSLSYLNENLGYFGALIFGVGLLVSAYVIWAEVVSYQYGCSGNSCVGFVDGFLSLISTYQSFAELFASGIILLAFGMFLVTYSLKRW
jgi:hypothetical protein